jgi:hypothetical protein
MSATLQRWKQMKGLGAVIPDGSGTSAPVRTKDQGLAFFRGIAYAHTPLVPIAVNSPSHAWLLWLMQGHYNYAELCPRGVDHFHVHRNSDLGYGKPGPNDHRGFSVTAVGATAAREFSYKQALEGVPKDVSEKRRIAFRHAIEYQVSHWTQQNFRGGICPVFGTVLQQSDVQIDHDPPFAELVRLFCEQQYFRLEDIAVEDTWTGSSYVWLLKEPLLSLWRKFHWTNMCLRFVSTAGHLELDRRRHEQERLLAPKANLFSGLKA